MEFLFINFKMGFAIMGSADMSIFGSTSSIHIAQLTPPAIKTVFIEEVCVG